MISLVPLVATPAQTLTVQLGNQNVRLIISQKAFGLFVDVYVSDVLVIGGVIARNLARIVRAKYRGFAGDFYFFDTHGNADPEYHALGSRYVLLYDDAA